MFEDKKILATLDEVIHLLHESIRLQFKILNHFNLQNIVGFVISQQGDDTMPLLPIAPGFAPVFTATPVPPTAVPNPATPPVWTSSDTVNFPISVNLANNLQVTANIPSTATVGATGTLSISCTNQDGTVATGSFSWTIVAAPSPDITSFSISQTA